MAAITIPDAILGVTRRLTANEVALYSIDCGPGGIWHGQQNHYQSGNPALAAYVFMLPSCVMDGQQLYTLTIYRADALPEPDPANLEGGARRRRRRRNTRRRA